MYNRFEKGMQPRQSVTDYLMAVKEESQQLEEELEALEEVRHISLLCLTLEGNLSRQIKCSTSHFLISDNPKYTQIQTPSVIWLGFWPAPVC